MQILLFLLILCSVYKCEASLCDGCRNILREFNKLFEKSAFSNFGGGNTHWEETRQGSFNASEVRLMEILDGLYGSEAEIKYTGVLPKIEEYIETWWSRDFRSGLSGIDALEQFVCINKSMFCCPWNTYGSTCSHCLPCSLSGGRCDGNGTRLGSGECVCLPGFTGATCDACNLLTNFQTSESESESSYCLPCHQSCSGGCSGGGPEHCNACKSGWKFVKGVDETSTEVCVDVNECEENAEICPTGTYCVNRAGTFDCSKCSYPCISCVGAAGTDCKQCAPGYTLSSDLKCVDTNECEDPTKYCQNENEKCINTQGSFRCDCEKGFSRIKGKCLEQKSKPPNSGARLSKTKSKTKVIWTVPYAIEFLKFIVIMTLFVFLLYYFSNRTILCLSMFVIGLSYICYQSTVFDFLFNKHN